MFIQNKTLLLNQQQIRLWQIIKGKGTEKKKTVQ